MLVELNHRLAGTVASSWSLGCVGLSWSLRGLVRDVLRAVLVVVVGLERAEESTVEPLGPMVINLDSIRASVLCPVQNGAGVDPLRPFGVGAPVLDTDTVTYLQLGQVFGPLVKCCLSFGHIRLLPLLEVFDGGVVDTIIG